MTKTLAFLTAVILTGLGVPRTSAALEVSVDSFYDNLDPYGDWVEVGDYGYCWHPRDVDRNWRPYSDGRWVYSDAGWTWLSEEPYAWAVYHYGRWSRVERIGWVWIPGTEWGPAWVSWRHSDRYVGWAPLPPEARFSASVGFGSSVDVSFDIGPTYYSFVEVRNIGAPRLREVIVEPQQNLTIINQTTNITNIRTVNNVVVNEGPRYEVVARASAQPIQRLKLERTTAAQGDPRALGTKVEGGSLRVATPAMAPAKPDAKPKTVAAKIDKAEVSNGWKDAGPADEVDKVRAKMKSEPKTAATERGNQSAPAAETKPKPGEPLSPTNEKPGVTGQPQLGGKAATPPPMKGKAGKPAPVAPGEPSPLAPDGKAKPLPPSDATSEPSLPSPERSKPGKPAKPAPVAPREPSPSAPDANGKPLPPSDAAPEPRVPSPEKGRKDKRPSATEPPPSPAVPGEQPREPKVRRQEAQPSQDAVPGKAQRMQKGEPKPEAPGVVPHRPGPPDTGATTPDGKGKKDKDKDKDQPAPPQ